MISLNQLLQYEEPNVIARYDRDYARNQLTGKEAWKEMLKYLWLCQKFKQDRLQNPNNPDLDFSCMVYEEMQEIDDMWHTFLLFTQEYAAFCEKFFGNFIHHIPQVEKSLLSENAFEADFTRYLSYIYDHLGEKTLAVWFK